MKILLAILAIGGAAAIGYTFGYDHGFEKAAGEGAAAGSHIPVDDAEEEMGDLLVGQWRSEEDSGFTREYRADGTVVDRHESMAGVVETPGTWRVVSGSSAASLPFVPEPGVAYVQQEMEGEAYHFRVGALTPTSMELVYMERGGVLRFTRD